MLRPRKKLTRREIKEDTLVTVYIHVQKFIQKHSKFINIGLFGLVVVFLLVIMISRSKRKAEVRALEQLAIAEQAMYSEQNGKAIDEFNNVMDLYPGTSASGKACFLLATTFYSKGDYLNAQKYFETYLDDYGHNKLLTVSSIAGIADCYDNLEQYEQAAKFYEKAAKKDENDYLSPVYYRNAGRCYILANNIEKGKKIYQMILDLFPDVYFAKELELLIETL